MSKSDTRLHEINRFPCNGNCKWWVTVSDKILYNHDTISVLASHPPSSSSSSSSLCSCWQEPSSQHGPPAAPQSALAERPKTLPWAPASPDPHQSHGIWSGGRRGNGRRWGRWRRWRRRRSRSRSSSSSRRGDSRPHLHWGGHPQQPHPHPLPGWRAVWKRRCPGRWHRPQGPLRPAALLKQHSGYNQSGPKPPRSGQRSSQWERSCECTYIHTDPVNLYHELNVKMWSASHPVIHIYLTENYLQGQIYGHYFTSLTQANLLPAEKHSNSSNIFDFSVTAITVISLIACGWHASSSTCVCVWLLSVRAAAAVCSALSQIFVRNWHLW